MSDYKTPARNFHRIRFEKIRSSFDAKYNIAHDELSDAYYSYWKKGLSHAWKGYDVQATPEQSKTLFDKLHGLIFLKRDVDFHDFVQTLPEKDRIPEREYNEIRDSSGIVIGKVDERARAQIQTLQADGIDLTL